MRKLTAAVMAFLLVLMVGCGKGGDSSSSIVERNRSMAQPESPPVEPEAESSQSESSPESLQPLSESSVPSPTPESTAAPTAKPTPAPTAKPTPTPKAEQSGETEYILSSDTVKAGNYLTLTCKNPPPLKELSLKVSLNGVFQLMENGDEVVSLIGVSRNIAPGSYKAVVSENGSEVAVLPFTVVDAGFEREEFEMDESVQNSTVNSSTARDEYNRITASVMAASTAGKSLPDVDGFIMPIDPPTFRISSSYGFTRVVNGKVSGRHEGVDFPAPKGTPVVAAGDGRVLYAGLMQMTGNTVIIEHGMGLKSWYHHMDSLSCATGDVLSAGDPVGKVGTTGYSTGNHLHFGMSINDTYTNPWQFLPARD